MMIEYFKQKLLNYCKSRGRITLDDLQHEILADIVSRVPMEGILACRQVCRKWYCLTRDQYFIKLHLDRSKSLLLLEPVKNCKERNYPNTKLYSILDVENKTNIVMPAKVISWRDFKVMCTCNGLLCIKDVDQKIDPLCLHNPLTGQYFTLPCSGEKRLFSRYSVCIGFDPSSGWYKVLRYGRFERGKKANRLEILTLGQSRWREIKVPLELDWYGTSWTVFCNGAFYLQFEKKDLNQEFLVWMLCIVRIDFREEKVEVMNFPRTFMSRPFVEMLDTDGSLLLVDHDSHMMRTWSLYRNAGKGDFVFRREDEYDTGGSWNSRIYFKMVRKVDECSYLLYITWKGVGDELAWYTPGIVGQHTFLDIKRVPNHFNIFHFKPSFVSPLAAALTL